jgi:hypothetical protein
MREESAGAKLALATDIMAIDAARKGAPINTDQARQAALDLAGIAKQVKAEAARQPAAVADACIKLMAKREANQRAVLAEMVKAVFGPEYDILPVGDYAEMLADAEAYRKSLRAAA